MNRKKKLIVVNENEKKILQQLLLFSLHEMNFQFIKIEEKKSESKIDLDDENEIKEVNIFNFYYIFISNWRISLFFLRIKKIKLNL